MYSTIIVDVVESIMFITLNRPDKLNAFNPAMCDELLDAFDRAEDDSVRAVVVTGAGRAFCAGGEVTPRGRDANERESSAGEAARDPGGLVALKIFNCTKPVIGAANGAAVGFGATALLPMDIRMASTKARFGFPFATLGTVPEAASTWFLPRIVGVSRSIEWCLTGELQSAETMLAAGFLRSVHPPEELMDAVMVLARKIAGAAPVSAALTRQMMWRIPSAPHPMAAHIIESRLVRERMQAADMSEAIASFLENRRPVFRDRVSTDMPSSYPWWAEPPFE